MAIPAPTAAAGKNGLAIGYGAATSGTNSVAIGNGSSDGGRANVVSVGTAGATRQVVNVGAGVLATDAVNVSQLQPLVTALGGGATFNTTTGAVTGPTYNVGGVNYTDVGSAIAATNKLAVQYTADSSGNPTNHITLSGANNGQPVTISNLAAGVAARPDHAGLGFHQQRFQPALQFVRCDHTKSTRGTARYRDHRRDGEPAVQHDTG